MACQNPVSIRGSFVSCGQCSECLRVKAWRYMARMVVEASISPTLFVTLTLRREMTPVTGYKLVQRFLKRLRKTGAKVRYACVAERGGQRGRLHFHMLLHGHNLSDHLVRRHWRGGISHTSRVGCSDASRVGRYGSKMARYATKGGERFRFSQGYGSFALKVLMEKPVVKGVRDVFPGARVVRVGGVRLPSKLMLPVCFPKYPDDVLAEAHVALTELRELRLLKKKPSIVPLR